MDNRQIITDLLLDTRRKGMDKVVEFLDENDFFVLPASTRYQNRETGYTVCVVPLMKNP